MSLALVHSRAREGVRAPAVRIEVHLSGGLPNTTIVGLPEAAVRESKDRVRAAIQNAQYEYPQRRVTVNLAPADVPKDGARFDLPIALGILAANGQIPLQALASCEFVGELALTGELRAVDGVLPAAIAARELGRTLFVPSANAAEVALVSGVDARVARTLLEICAHLQEVRVLSGPEPGPAVAAFEGPDLADVRGQAHARRALEIAAAGGHHLLLIGPPGCGKTLLATRLSSILPPMSEVEALETAAIGSVSGHGVDLARWKQRPYRAPHHTASAVALVGGGTEPRPGEISLAHNGVLFLDELAEWDRRTLDVLREPMESGRVHISRAARQAEYPARFQLVAATNPCPCGWAGDGNGRCRCTGDQVARYRARLSGPLIDRIDLHVAVPRVAQSDLRPDAPPGESSATVRARVVRARDRQAARAGKSNALLGQRETERTCRLAPSDQALLERAIDALELSARATHRILRIARTIADLAGSETIATMHLMEAIGYRQLDRRPSAVTS